MAQGSYIFTNVAGHSTEECVSNHLETECSYYLGLDYSPCLDSFHNGSTIKRLSLKRRPRVAENNMEKAQTGGSPGQWHSAESLSSPSSDATRLLGMSTAAKGRPPLPPPHGSSLDKHPSRNEGSESTHTHSEFRPLPAARSLAPQRKSPTLEKTIIETKQQLEQEVTSHLPPQPSPRRRLASFGGVSSAGSLSPFTGLGAYNQNNNGNKPAGFDGDAQSHLSPSLGSRGSTGCLRLSPQGSGRSTPVSLGSMHLQHVRDQMVVALQRLKELEEQVKIIPILQVKVSVLQEEKRQLVCQLKNQSDNDINNVIFGRTSSLEESNIQNKDDCGKVLETKEYRDCTDFKEFRQLTEEMQALERTIQGGQLTAFQGKNDFSLQDKASKPLAAGRGKDVELLPTKENKCMYTEQIETKSITTQVSEITLGIYTERDAEMDAQQLMINTLKERICHLEADLKESALQTEMSRLKLELRAAGARNRVDKASSARPSTTSTATEARPHTTSQGIGNHTKFQDACTGDALEVKTVGVSCCRPELKNVSTGPDLPMGHWELRKRVQTREMGVGVHVSTNTQGVGVEIEVCDAESNTDALVEDLQSGKPKITYRSVACGDCSIDVIVCEPREVVSQGTITDLVKGVELGIMATPQTASQRTNTASSSVSRFTNTKHAFNTDSSTNTVLNTQDKHTNTAQAITRTVSVGNGVKDMKPTTETRTVGVGTTNPEWTSSKLWVVNKTTRDTGVGFTNINENYLVGLKTRNMASGPSHLPDPIKTRSIGVGEGRIRDLSAASGASAQGLQRQPQSQWDPELNHYIEKMQRLLGEHGELLAEDFTPHSGGFAQQNCSQGYATSNLSFSNKTAAQVVHPLQHLQPPAEREFFLPSQLPEDSSKCDRVNPGMCQEGRSDSEVKRMIQMLEQQSSSALQDRSNKSGGLQRVTKKQNGDQGCSSTRKSMRLIKVTTGLDPVSYKPSASERVDSEEVERRGSRKLKKSSTDAAQTGEGKGGSHRGLKGPAKSHTKLKCRLSTKMYSACQALKMHLDDETVLSSRELHDCLQTLQQEWFSVSSHKSAAADTLEHYLSTFRVVSPSVLQHIANMSDGNGNTALHYSVSHSNFDIVKKLLDAEVCNVDQQNKAGYTPIMLAALAAVEAPEDMRVVEQLFMKGDVNAKASQAGQTALMLAVSHGRMDMVRALLARGAEVNLQDDEGSTALMCACEHGHADMVKLLLAQPRCDATLTDSDESTALSIALEAGHNDIAVLLYAHANFSKGQAAAAAHHGGRPLPSSGGRAVLE